MKRYSLKGLIFMALCCDLGLVGKQMILPLMNVLTGLLKLPGGVATSFSLMFIVIGAASVAVPGAATLMCVLQSLIALTIGMTGSMGLLAPISYILPGVVIDFILFISKRRPWGVVLSLAAASVTACLVTNYLSHKLTGIFLMQYAMTAAISGAVFGLLGLFISSRISPYLRLRKENA